MLRSGKTSGASDCESTDKDCAGKTRYTAQSESSLLFPRQAGDAFSRSTRLQERPFCRTKPISGGAPPSQAKWGQPYAAHFPRQSVFRFLPQRSLPDAALSRRLPNRKVFGNAGKMRCRIRGKSRRSRRFGRLLIRYTKEPHQGRRPTIFQEVRFPDGLLPQYA